MSMMICNAKLIDSNVPSVTGNIYPVEILNKIAKKQVIYGELGSPSNPVNIDLDKCSHKIVNFDVRNGVLYGDVQVLSTPMGELFSLFGQYDSNKIEFRPRGIGKANNTENPRTITEYEIIAIDCYIIEEIQDVAA